MAAMSATFGSLPRARRRFRHQLGRGLRANPLDRRQQLPDLVRSQEMFDVTLEVPEATTKQVQVFTEEAYLAGVHLGVMVPDGGVCRAFQSAGELAPHGALAPSDARDLAFGGRADRGGGGEGLQQRGGARTIQLHHIARELRKAQIDHPMELPRAVAKVLEEAGPQTDELAQIPRCDIREQRGRRPLLLTETCQPESIDRVRLGPDQVLLGKAPSTQRIAEYAED